MISIAQQARANLERARELRAAGRTYRQIRRQLGLTSSQICRIRRTLKREKAGLTRLSLLNPKATPHELSVGACELPPALCHAAADHGRLLADTLFGIEDEAGDLLQAGIDWAAVQPFETAILQADAIRARAGSPLVFKSVGYALWDLAACVLASRA